jgi:hypothetical protein
MLTMTATVKAMDSQRWICRTHVFQFNGTSFEDELKRIGAPSAAAFVATFADVLDVRLGGLASGFGLVQGHGGANERLQRLFVYLLALMEVDGAPCVPVEAGVEEA